MRVLLSIKPEFASKIFDGSKKYEYRRTIFKRKDVESVVVYATDPIKNVIGEFEIEEIIHEEPYQLWEKTNMYAGISRLEFMKYFGGKTKGYAIGIKKPQKYPNPLSLRELTVLIAPQSFIYLNANLTDIRTLK